MLFHGADALSPTGRRWTFTFSLCAEFLRNRLTLYIAQKWKNSGLNGLCLTVIDGFRRCINATNALHCIVRRLLHLDGVLLWSWRESNPRPNEESMCFLHAYLRRYCREAASAKLPTATLAS